VDHSDGAICVGEPVCDWTSVIGTAIIDNDYFKIGLEFLENFDRPLDDSFYVRLFVVAREKNAYGDGRPA
jgi:hypothetical protein